MALSDHDQSRIRQYLLGHLTEEEQQSIEERLMVEDDLCQELEISKGELIEEYRAGELDQNDNSWFEQNYLASSEGRQRYTFALAFDCLRVPAAPAPRATLLDRIRTLLTTQKWALAPIAAVVLIAVVIFAMQFSRPRTSIAVSLSNSFGNRSAGENKYRQVSLKSDIQELRVSLLLPDSAVRGTNYRVVLDKRGETENLAPTAYDANSVSVVIPTSQLPPGFYSLKLFAIDADRTERRLMGDYLFEITK
ncbi:MAG TPA: hypothetical protein VJ875_02215 [Pyrinomonadaceae bacterium]|nr:hypothetical protein [Pyrinomonadaceae bacterium]